jgi:hypothetical protein
LRHSACSRALSGRALLDRIATSRVNLSFTGTSVDDAFELLGGFGNFRCVVDPAVKTRIETSPASIRSDEALQMTVILDTLARQAGVCWTVEADGTLHVVRLPQVK